MARTRIVFGTFWGFQVPNDLRSHFLPILTFSKRNMPGGEQGAILSRTEKTTEANVCVFLLHCQRGRQTSSEGSLSSRRITASSRQNLKTIGKLTSNCK